jgi:hypothetical protein
MKPRFGLLAAAAPSPEHSFLPRVLPADWRKEEVMDDGATYRRRDGLFVIVSMDTELDSRHWLHVSCSHGDRLPSWEELAEVKTIFIGRDRCAYQVLPPAAKHVNFHRYALHLWFCLDAPPEGILPDFTRGGGMV